MNTSLRKTVLTRENLRTRTYAPFALHLHFSPSVACAPVTILSFRDPSPLRGQPDVVDRSRSRPIVRVFARGTSHTHHSRLVPLSQLGDPPLWWWNGKGHERSFVYAGERSFRVRGDTRGLSDRIAEVRVAAVGWHRRLGESRNPFRRFLRGEWARVRLRKVTTRFTDESSMTVREREPLVCTHTTPTPRSLFSRIYG